MCETADESANIAPAPPISYTTTIDSCEAAAVLVVRAVSAVSGREPRDLSSLYEIIDTEALTDLFEHNHESDISCSFTYEGYEIELTYDTITVTELKN